MFGHDDDNTQNDDVSAMNPTLDSGDTPAPQADDTPNDAPAVDLTPAPELPAEPAPPEAAPAVDDIPNVPPPANTDDDAELLALKKTALEELTPLVDSLDQEPEEKFKTTMMMIQATDSANLVKTAHETALKISDEKVRAQALLDIINEINYFTQPKE